MDGKIYAIGGSDRIGGGSRLDKSWFSTVEVYDLATDTWTEKSPMPTPRLGLSTSVMDGKIYAIGGGNTSDRPWFSTVEVFDPATDTWTTKAPMPTPRIGLSSSVVDGRIYAIGGGDYPDLHPFSIVEAYDPALDPIHPITSIQALFWGALKAMFR
jgi:N-acetylneuraminic acid mutarotase